MSSSTSLIFFGGETHCFQYHRVIARDHGAHPFVITFACTMDELLGMEFFDLRHLHFRTHLRKFVNKLKEQLLKMYLGNPGSLTQQQLNDLRIAIAIQQERYKALRLMESRMNASKEVIFTGTTPPGKKKKSSTIRW